MQTLYRVILGLHVLGGATGLLSMALPLLSKKGARMHRLTGFIFTGGMGISSLTGLAMASAWVAAPARFQPLSTPTEARLDGVFLALIGCLTGNALIQAIAAVRRKHLHTPASIVTRLSLTLLVAMSLLSLGLGLRFGQTLPLVFGLGSLALAIQDLAFTLRPLRSPMAWWYQHMNAMGTACISAVTAFLVLGARRWFSGDALGDHAWMLWLLPTAVFVPLFQGWIAFYRRKFEGRTKARPVREVSA